MPDAHDEAEPADTPRLSELAAQDHIHGICFKTGPPARVGVELEWLVRDPGDAAAPADHDRVTQALAGLTAAGELPGGGRLTIEPGGQVEVSSAPATGIGSCVTQTGRDLAAVREALGTAGLTLAGRGVDPYRLPARVLDLPRYAAMEQFFDRGGPWGRVMMCSTASVQVCVDAGDEGDGPSGFRFRWRLLHALGPVLVAAFANSPMRAGRPTGWKSTRQAVWAQLDPGRTRAPAGAEPWPPGGIPGGPAGPGHAGPGHAGPGHAGPGHAGPDRFIDPTSPARPTDPPSHARPFDPTSHVTSIDPTNHVSISSNGSTTSHGDGWPGAVGAAGVNGGDPGGRKGWARWGAAAPGWPPNPRGPGHGGTNGTGRGGAVPDAAGPSGALDPRAAWAEYALDAQVMCVRRGDDQAWSAPPGVTFRDWLRGRGCEERPPTMADLTYHLSTLFPPVRPQGHLEVRYIDAQVGDGWIVPAAVVSALADDPVAAQAAMAAAEEVWQHGSSDLNGNGNGHSGGPPGPWLRGARHGLDDPVLARAARECFEAAAAALGRAGAPPDVRRRVAEFAEEYVVRGRCPADDMRDTLEESR